MRYRVPYAGDYAEFETGLPCTVAECQCAPVDEPDRAVERALLNPISSPGFEEFARSSRRLCFILCDGTRPTPTARVLEHLHKDIFRHPDVRFLIAVGTHRPPTEAEFRSIFGRFHDDFMPLTSVHDSRDADSNVFLGTTSRGTPVSLSRYVMESDGIVTINSVEPHYFAGYTGGRKSFLPGVAAFESIERNHSHAAEPGAMPMALEGNPVSEDMSEALDLLGPRRIFSVQTVMTPDGGVRAAFSGDIRETFSAAVAKANEIYSVEVRRAASIVITVAPPPMDIDLYQSQKALEHGSLALEPGGVMILVSGCWDGIGDTGFYRLLERLGPGESVSDFMGANYRLGNHKVARLLNLLGKGDVFAVTGLDRNTLEVARILGFDTLQAAVDGAVSRLEGKGISPDILIMPSGSLTVPRLVND